MSNLVRYPVGNTEFRDFLNWPTILRAEIDDVGGVLTEDERDEIWPVDITRDQAMVLAWRVRKWRLSGDCTCAIDYDDPGVQHISALGTSVMNDVDVYTLILDEDENEIAATTEGQIVDRQFDDTYRALVNGGIAPLPDTGPSFDWEISGTDDFGGGPIPFLQSGSVTPPAGFRIFSEFVLYDVDTKKFAPKFLGFGGVIPLVFSERLLMNANFFRNPVTNTGGIAPLLQQAAGTMTIVSDIFDDFDVPLQLEWRLSGQTPGSTISGSADANFTLTAVEYWPYKNSMDLPVYDTADGSELVDPFS